MSTIIEVGEEATLDAEWAEVGKGEVGVGLCIAITDKLKAASAKLKIYEMWVAGEKEKYKRAEKYVSGVLSDFTRDAYAKTGEKTYKLPNGAKLSLRAGRDKIIIEGGKEADLLAWAEEQADAEILLLIKKSVSMKGLKTHMESTGEVPPHCLYMPGGDLEFSFKID